MKRIIIFFTMLVFCYFIGAFINVSFDISTWSIECRTIIALFGMAVSAFLSTYPGIKD